MLSTERGSGRAVLEIGRQKGQKKDWFGVSMVMVVVEHGGVKGENRVEEWKDEASAERREGGCERGREAEERVY